MEGYELGVVVGLRLSDQKAFGWSEALCRKLMTAAENHDVNPDDYGDLLQALF